MSDFQLGRPRHHLAEVDSTSAHLKRLIAEGADAGTVVTADAQTAGYGQRGRSWVSEPGKGLYLSVLLPMPAQPTHLPFVLGLGVHDALAPWAPEVGLKWVNDLVARRRKLGGMLIELARGAAVAGVGLNLSAQAGDEAISLAELCASAPDREALLDAVIAGIDRRYRQWRAEGFEPIRAGWSAASVTLGQSVQVLDEPALTGVAEALGPAGELMLRSADGTLKPVLSGTIRTVDGRYC